MGHKQSSVANWTMDEWAFGTVPNAPTMDDVMEGAKEIPAKYFGGRVIENDSSMQKMQRDLLAFDDTLKRIFLCRRKKKKQQNYSDEQYYAEDQQYYDQNQETIPEEDEDQISTDNNQQTTDKNSSWKCRNCGTENKSTNIACRQCKEIETRF